MENEVRKIKKYFKEGVVLPKEFQSEHGERAPKGGLLLLMEDKSNGKKPTKEKKNKRKKEKRGRQRLVSVKPIAGTRDWYPEDMRLRKWLIGKWRSAAENFAFEEYDSPILESTKLYTVKSGEEICGQMYNFEDKSKQPICLRPEMTPSLARLVMKGGDTLVLPLKWYSCPQCWRWETLTRGRKREFYQWNVDILGVRYMSGDAEVIATLIFFLISVGLTNEDAQIRLSSRKVLETYILSLNTEKPKEDFGCICGCIDKYEKVTIRSLKEKLKKMEVKFAEDSEESIIQGLCEKNEINYKEESYKVLAEILEEHPGLKDLTEDQVKKVIDFVRCKTAEDVLKLADGNQKMIGAVKEVVDFVKIMEEGYGLKNWVTFDVSIIRGLAYYDGIVFEAFAKKGLVQRAIAGGGRYDTLLQAFGEKRVVPAVGFGLGDVVITEVLKDLNLLPQFSRKVDDCVVPFNVKFMTQAIIVATRLRAKGRVVDIAIKKYRKLKQAFSYADRIGAERVVLIAPDEWEQGKVVIKDLRGEKGENQEIVDISSL